MSLAALSETSPGARRRDVASSSGRIPDALVSAIGTLETQLFLAGRALGEVPKDVQAAVRTTGAQRRSIGEFAARRAIVGLEVRWKTQLVH
jgi:hypothetical protein